jgi:hypothetical protein
MGPFDSWRSAAGRGRRNRPTRAALAAIPLLVAACASSRPVQVVQGQRTRVVLTDVAAQRSFALQNASSGAANEVYSDRSADDAVKVVTDANLQQLLDVLATQGMFERAAAAAAPDARDLLVVESGGRRWVWSRRLRGIDAAELPFHEARSYFLTFYNSVVAWHAGDVDRQGFAAEQARAQQGGEAARQRLEQLQRRDR